MCLRLLQCHRIFVLHGVVVGGGVALALHTHVRFGAAASTLSFGNLSRGAVPGMRLSRTLRRAHCLAFGLSLFQTDLLIAMNTSLVVHIAGCHSLFFTLLYAGAMASRSIEAAHKLPIEAVFDEEVVGITMGCKTGSFFRAALKRPRTTSSYLLIHICAESITCFISSGM